MNVGNHYTHLNRAIILNGGSDFFTTLEKMIHEAQSLIHIQTYIFSDDETGQKVAEALIEAAHRKVEIYIIADGIASQSLSNYFIERFKSNGIKFRFFEPLLKTKACYLGRRLHQKIICIDNQKALVGGINIANRYNDLPKRKAWLDFAVCIEGEVVIAINDFCHSIWHSLPYRDIEINNDARNTFEKIIINERCKIRIRRNDWIRHKNEISISYLEMLRNSQEEIIILCSYFIPGKAIRRHLASAAKRGVNIKVITAGPSDVMIAKRAERWLYDWLLRNKIELYEYQKNILHGKLAVADQQQITIGSYNINNISTYTSIELNVDIDNAYLAKQLHQELTAIIDEDCYKITEQNHQLAKNAIIQFNRWFSYQFISVVLKAVTFFFKREH